MLEEAEIVKLALILTTTCCLG